MYAAQNPSGALLRFMCRDITPANGIRFFIDNDCAAGSCGETSTGIVARIRVYPYVLGPTAVKNLDRGLVTGPPTITSVTPASVPRGTTHAFELDEGWGGYPVDEVALRHGAGVERETNDAAEAYAGLPTRKPTACRDGWLPDGEPSS